MTTTWLQAWKPKPRLCFLPGRTFIRAAAPHEAASEDPGLRLDSYELLYLHAGAAGPPPRRWSCGGPEAASRPSQSHCRSGSRDGSGPAGDTGRSGSPQQQEEEEEAVRLLLGRNLTQCLYRVCGINFNFV